MLKALALSTSQENDNEIAMLKQELDTLNRYPNFVMYSSQGVKAAIEAQKALALFDPTANFLIAYLQYNSQGAVQGSHLLIDDSSGGEKEIAFHTTHFFPDAHTPYDRLNPEIMHPLFFQLSALLSGRQRVLGEIGNEITALIAQENQGKIIDFDQHLRQLTEKYITTDREQLTTLYKKIVALNQDYSTMPMSEFMQYIKIAGLEPLFPFFMQNPTSSLGSLSTNFFPPSSLKQITESTDLEELESLLSAVHSHINLNALPDPKKLISLQHQLKSATLNKVDFFLFSPKIAIEAQFFSAENRQRLKNILKLAWVRDEDEINFYVSEFDSLCSEKLLEDQETDQVKEAEQTTPLITLSGPQAGWYQAPLWERFSPKKHHLISP